MRKLFTLLLIFSLIFIHTSVALAASQVSQKSTKKITTKVTTKSKSKSKIVSKKKKPKKQKSQLSATTKKTMKARITLASRSESKVDAILRRGASVIGTPYAYGSSGNGSFDCSGFTIYAYKAADVQLPRSSVAQASLGQRVAKADLQKGDLVFFNDRGDTRIGHVGIYIGDNSFIHASRNLGITITSLSDSYYAQRYVGARRILGD